MTEIGAELAELRDHMSLPADADAATIVRHAKIAFDLSEDRVRAMGTTQKPQPACNCGSCKRDAAARNAPIPYLRRLVAELIFDALDGSQRGRGVQPIHTNSDVDEAAVAVLGLVQPELEQLASEARALRADKDIRQGALNGVLGRPASTDCYEAIQAVADLVNERRRLEKVAAEVERLKDVDAEAFAARFQVQSYDIELGRAGRTLARLLTEAGVSPLPDRLWYLAHRVKEEFEDVVRQRDEALAALETQQALLAEVQAALPPLGACSCNPTLVVLHESGSYCGDPQYEAMHELLDAELTSANLAGEEDRPYGAASRAGDLVLELLDILRGKKSRLEVPITEVRLDGLVPDENLERLRAILRGDESGPGVPGEADASPAPRVWAPGSSAPDESVTEVIAENDVTFKRTSRGEWQATPPEGNGSVFSWAQINQFLTLTEVPEAGRG